MKFLECADLVYKSALAAGMIFALTGCGSRTEVSANAGSVAPPAAVVEHETNNGSISVDHPEQYPLAKAGAVSDAPELNVTGAVSPDISRNIPVISLASGRVVEIKARIGDTVTKGQLLMRVQSTDVSQAFSDYRQALADAKLAATQLSRSKLLFERGAIAQKDVEVAEDTAAKANVTVETTTEKIRVLGADINQPSSLIDIPAPASGVITEQNITAAAGVKTLDNSPNLFTISDVSVVWVICDVFENDLPNVRLGEMADIHLNAFPKLVLKGRVSNIGAQLDANLRTAKVRLEVPNPGPLRFGMFVTATFHGMNSEMHATVPAAAVLHLHDRDWVYVPDASNNGHFHRVEVVGGKMLPDNQQEIVSGIKPGQPVVSRALVFQNSMEQ